MLQLGTNGYLVACDLCLKLLVEVIGSITHWTGDQLLFLVSGLKTTSLKPV